MAYTVLHCLARMNRGGAETMIMNIFRHIDRKKYRFCFLLIEEDCDYKDEIMEYGGIIYTIPTRSQGIVRYCRALDSFFGEHEGKFDAIHYHTSSLSSLEVLYYARKHGIKTRVIHSHNTVQSGLVHNILHWINKPMIGMLATDWLACSKVASDWLYKYTGVMKKAFVINNGIDLNRFAYDKSFRKEIRQKHDIPEDALVIGHVGRFDEVKNHKFLLEIFSEFLKIHPEAVLVCVGRGILFDEIVGMVRDKGLERKVIFAGLQSEIYKYLSAFDYFVFPSLYEGLPVALVEAQASGVMTICSDAVSPESRLSDYLSFRSLNDTAESWAEYMGSIEFLDRTEAPSQIREKGYGIDSTVAFLTENVYL